MIGLGAVYVLMGFISGGVAMVNLRDRSNPRRFNNAAFWGLYAVTFFVGGFLPDVVNGVIVLLMAGIAGIGKLGPAPAEVNTRADREASARRWGNKLFVPALAIPVITIVGSKYLKAIPVGDRTLIDPKDATIVWLGIGTVGALLIGMAMLRPKPSTPIVEARRLWDSVGWAAVLPQSLAALGAVFAIGGIGKIVAQLADRWLPLGTPLAAVIAYTVGMALLTILMGNAFAAFPVMTAGIALPLVVEQFHGNVVIVTAVGMLSGFCGTLMTPMAANFNIVPVALLELPDQNAVIKTQIPTAIPLLAANTLLMYLLVFRY